MGWLGFGRSERGKSSVSIATYLHGAVTEVLPGGGSETIGSTYII